MDTNTNAAAQAPEEVVLTGGESAAETAVPAEMPAEAAPEAAHEAPAPEAAA